MSANLDTFIEFEGSLDEINAMITVIKDYCGYKHDASLEFVRLCPKRKFDGKNDVSLETLSNEKLQDFLAHCKKKVFLTAGGPYGSYGRTDEAGIFEAIAEAVPTAKFDATTSGFTTGQRDSFNGELKDGKLYLTYSYLLDDAYCEDEDEDEESEENWITEKTIIYNPIDKEYENKYSVEEYVHSMVKKMTLNDFKNLFGLADEDISDKAYYDYVFKSYYAYSFPNMNYIDFKYFFPKTKITNDEFDKNVAIAIEKFGLVSFEKFCG